MYGSRDPAGTVLRSQSEQLNGTPVKMFLDFCSLNCGLNLKLHWHAKLL